MEKDKIRSRRQCTSFELVSPLSSVDPESPYRHHPTFWEKQRGLRIPGRRGSCVFLYTAPFFKRGGKEFQAWLKLQVAFLQAQVINWAGINAHVCYKKRPRILIKAISQHIGEVTLNSETLLMRQSRLITDSPRAFIFLQLHLQKHCALEVLCQVPALWRSVLANRVSAWGTGQCRGAPSSTGAAWAAALGSCRRAAGASEEPSFSSSCWSMECRKVKMCSHLCSETLQRALKSEALVAQKQTGRRVSLLPAKANGCLLYRLHALLISKVFWPIPARLLISSEVPEP